MELAPKDLLEKLEFDKIRELLCKECYGELARDELARLSPRTEKFILERQLDEVEAFLFSMNNNDALSLNVYEDISEHLRMLGIEGYVLPIEGLQSINRILITIREVFRYFEGERQSTYPVLFDIIRSVSFDGGLIKAIERVIDEDGKIKPNASPELQRINRMYQSKQRELDRVFKGIINTNRNNGWLTDNIESFRNGRRVLSVPSEHKRKIRGIIHDESTTGKTAFIEPEGVIEINNDLFDLQTEEKREIYRILRELSHILRPYIAILRNYQDIVVLLDIIYAKARLAQKMDANKPGLKAGPSIGIKDGYHPLLFLKNKAEGKTTVPFNLKFIDDNRIIVISGPNAGGKSVTMKSVGLIQLMLQAGMLVPVHEESEMGIFESIFADIGDQQSLEDDLSTYSSRLKNAKYFLEHSDDKSLILIDEFGSGTDPKIGGAIAEGILKELYLRKVFSVITTHYSNLKAYAFKTKGIINGAMEFDKENLSPTYRLQVGRPGSSYAFEIGHKSGLPKKVLNYARFKAGKNERAVDQLLIDLQSEKKELEDKIEGLNSKQEKLDKLIKTYEQLQGEFEFKRKKLKLDIKQQELQETAQENKEFEKVIRQIKEAQNLEKAKQLAEEARNKRKALNNQVFNLNEEVYHKKGPKVKDKAIEVGDFVRMRSGGSTGKVESINKKEAVVVMGIMRITVKLRELLQAGEPLDIRTKKGIDLDVVKSSAQFESKLDIRGMRREDALSTLELFVDNAIISNTTILRIIHGKGNGVLRIAVKQKLREYDDVTNIYHPEPKEGGDGVTLVEMG